MRTLTPNTLNGGHGVPASGAEGCFEVYYNGTDIIGTEESDLVTYPLPIGITGSPKQTVVTLASTPFVIPPTFFGMHSQDTALESITYGAWRNLSAFVDWCYIETSDNGYDAGQLTKLDAMIAKCVAQGRDVVWCFANTPTWASRTPASVDPAYTNGSAWTPANFANLTRFINVLLTRYPGQIQYVEGWNEPNDTALYYKDTLANLVTHQQTIWNAVQAHNTATGRSIKVISPSFTGAGGTNQGPINLDAFLAAGGGAYCDIIGHHPYSMGNGQGLFIDRTVLQLAKSTMATRGLSAKGFMVTEGGDSVITNYTRDRFVRQMLFAAALGAVKFCWYSYDIPGIQDMRIQTQAATAWNDAVTYLSGKTIGWVNYSPSTLRLGALINGVPTLV